MNTLSRLKSHWFYLLFFMLVIAFFYDVIFLGKVLLLRDTFADFIPKLSFARRAYQDLAVPLWNPQTGCGHPFFADPYTGAAYPLNILFYIMPMSAAHKLSLVLHMTLAGSGMIALARLWGFGIPAALLCAISFVFSTYVIAVAEFFNILFPVCWGPVIFFLGCLIYERVKKRPAAESVPRLVLANWKTISLLAVCLACGYLAGNPQYLVFAIGLVTAYHIGRVLYERDYRSAMLSYACFLGAGGISLLLCMPQILLFLELLGESLRQSGIDPEMFRASVHPSHFWTLLFPFAFGKGTMLTGYWGVSMLEYWLGAFYVGLIPLMTAFFSAACFRRGDSGERRWPRFLFIFSGAAVVAGVILASGQYLPVYQALVDYVPGFDKVRWPSRFMLVWVYFVPLAAGLGLHLVVREKEKDGAMSRWFWLVPGAGGLLAIMLWAAYGIGDMGGLFKFVAGKEAAALPERLALLRKDWLTAATFMTVSVVLLWFLLRSRKKKSVLAAQFALVGVAFLNLAIVGRDVHPVSAEDVYSYEPPIWAQLGEMLKDDPHWRLYTKYGNNQFNLYEVDDPEIYKLAKTVSVGETWLQSKFHRVWRSSLSLERYTKVYNIMAFTQDPAVLLRFCDVVNTGILMYGPNWKDLVANPAAGPRLERRPNAVPRAYLVKSWRRVASYDEGIRVLVNLQFDLHREVLIEDSEDGAALSLPMTPGPAVNGAVRNIEYGWNESALTVETAENCLLVFVDSWFPGWKAFVDGREVPIFKANLLFRAVELPAGAKEVIFRYEPVRWRIGLVLCVLGIAVLAGGFLAARKIPRAEEEPAPGSGSDL